MKSRVRFYHYWDWKTIGISVSVLLAGFAFMIVLFFYDEVTRSYRLSRLDKETIGEVVRIEAQESMRQTKLGNIGIVDHYTIWYNYKVNGVLYTERNWINGNKRNGRLVRNIKMNQQMIVRVKYDSRRPKKSMVVLE